MPTKKEIFLELLNLIKSGIPEVENRVYSAYPKQEPGLPFIVIDNPEYSDDDFLITGDALSFTFSVDIYIYTNTSQQLDELSQKLIDLLKSAELFGADKTIKDNGSAEYKGTNKIMHEDIITLELSL